ncbi:hypothetical protein CARUB_v10004265mg [Capsella rubella]|uniref:HAT C-terminal dimerisation domain-containing protein n=1 Tax=Capsella rubella TaxID=81985 RepID=R0GV13_9BRAS|nr:hypothetical protein CARUB_v10004265mg [Capsella rubella]
MSSVSRHESNNDLLNEEVQGGGEEGVQVETSVGKKRTETERSSSDFPPKSRKKIAHSSDIWQHFTRIKHDRKRNGRCCDSDDDSSDDNLKPIKYDPDGFKRSVSEMVVLNGLPFSFVESEGFKRFCHNVIPVYEDDVSTRKATSDIVAMFLQEKASLKKLFSDGKKRVSLTVDIWEAPTTLCSYMIVTAFWIDVNWELQKRILSFKPVTDKEGETIARNLIECLDEWGIEKVFTVTVNNTESNDKALTLFKEAMRLKGANALVKDGEFLHMRCCAHIVNLIVKESIERASDSIAAVRNAVKYVQSSFTRLKSFELCAETGNVTKSSLSLDSITRWDSTYLMLKAALKLRVAFEKMLDEDKLYGEYFLETEKETGKKRVGPPISATWDELERLVGFLRIFFHCTVGYSKHKSEASSNGHNDIANIDWNLIELSNNDDEEVQKQAKSMRDKFEKYWDGLININPLVIVASVFDPRKKMKFSSLCFEMLHGKDSLEANHLTSSINTVMRHLYEEYITMLDKQSQEDAAANQSDHGDSKQSIVVSDLPDNELFIRTDSLYEMMLKKMREEQAGKELENYLIEPVERQSLGSDYDVLSWWKRKSWNYPVLSELARDVLAIQMSSFAPESAFCTSGRILDPYRSSLTPYITEAVICSQQWLQTSFQSEAPLPTLKEMFEELDFLESLGNLVLITFSYLLNGEYWLSN